MRKYLSKIHLWGGLLCAPYLIIFGFSSLHFNHHFGFVDIGERVVNWERQLEAVADTTDNGALAERVKKALDIDGWILWWRYERSDDNSFKFVMGRPGKEYRVAVNPARSLAGVEEIRRGPLRVMNVLHAMGPIPGKPYTNFWKYYTYICVLFVMYAGGSGIYFWSRSRNDTLIGWLLLAGVSGGSLLLMIFVWMRG